MTQERENWDRKGWAALVRRVAFLTSKPQDAQDLLHTAFLRLHDYRQAVPIKNASAFMTRAAVNCSIDQERHARIRAEIAQPLSDLIDLSDDQPLQDEVLIASRRLARVREGLKQLTPRTREIFLLHRLEGMKYREIADRFGISVSGVEKHIAKAALQLAIWTEGW